MNTVTLRIPGTTSNLGSGFDTLGLALQIYNRITLKRITSQNIELTSPVSPDAREGAEAMLRATAQHFFNWTKLPPVGFQIHIEGDVPVARGLGSSTTVQLGCLAGLNEITGAELDRETLFQRVYELEGHPDNVAPAVFGGFTVAGATENGTRVFTFPVPQDLHFIAVIPDFEVRTGEARNRLPQSYSRADLIHSLNRAALVTAAFASGEYQKLLGLFDDRVHQPYRAPLNPHLDTVLTTATQAGALGGWLSGSGSTVLCLAIHNADAVADTLKGKYPTWDIRVLCADPSGYTIE